jgi:opacity protein-like surface antigen
MFLAVLAAAAIACGSAAAVMPSTWVTVRAHLAPVSGTSGTGRFNGLLLRGGAASRWQLTWELSLPALRGPMTASLQVGAAKGAAPATQMLCKQCARGAKGAMTLTGSEALRVTRDDVVVVVQTPSATLRGPLKAFVHVPVPLR